MKGATLLATALAGALLQGGHAAVAAERWGGAHPVPPHFTATASLDRPEYRLGENVLLHFRLANNGAAPFNIEHGGDYRGAPRHLRFEVTATSADGKAALDPYPNITCMGGLGATHEIPAGQAFEQSLPLMHYLHFPAPGEYTLRVTHDLGWKVGPGQPGAAAEVKIKLIMPTAAEAEKVVDGMFALPPRPGSTMGQRSGDYSDLSVLRYPLYLPILERHVVQKREDQALRALSRMPDEAAIVTLLKLAQDQRGDDAAKLAQALATHLPGDPADEWEAAANRFPSDLSWRPKFVPDVRALAARLLEMPQDLCIAYGAEFLRRVGTPDDLGILTGALDRVIPQLAAAPRLDTIFSKRRDSAWALQRAARALLERGAGAPRDPRQPGEIAVYLVWLGIAKDLPGEAPQRLSQWVDHPIAHIRDLTLQATPRPPPAKLRERLPALIAGDDDVNVRMAAFRVAQETKDTACRDALVQRVAKAPSHWELEAAAFALKELGFEVDSWQAMAARLHETELTQRLLNQLAQVVKETAGTGWSGTIDPVEARRIQQRWAAWLNQHAEALRTGERISIHDPRMSAELFPQNFTISTAEGDWPKRAE